MSCTEAALDQNESEASVPTGNSTFVYRYSAGAQTQLPSERMDNLTLDEQQG